MKDHEKPYDGGDAFPVGNAREIYFGMTLRDWFAGMALPTIIDVCRTDEKMPGETFEQLFARMSYSCADAMIAERSK